jgi:sugar phosphate isomerase/epimerase
VDCLKLLEGRIISLHFKDLSPEKRDVPWGQGVCDVPGMLAELKRQKVKPVFIIEYESTRGDELISNVAKCVEAFSQFCEKLAAEK